MEIKSAIILGNGSLYRCNGLGLANKDGNCVACRHCKKLYSRNIIWALRHIEKVHGVNWAGIYIGKWERTQVEKITEQEEAYVSI